MNVEDQIAIQVVRRGGDTACAGGEQCPPRCPSGQPLTTSGPRTPLRSAHAFQRAIAAAAGVGCRTATDTRPKPGNKKGRAQRGGFFPHFQWASRMGVSPALNRGRTHAHSNANTAPAEAYGCCKCPEHTRCCSYSP